CESSTPANLLLSPADLLVRIRSQDQTGCASPGPSLPPNSCLSIGTTFPYFAPSSAPSAPRALNLLIPVSPLVAALLRTSQGEVLTSHPRTLQLPVRSH